MANEMTRPASLNVRLYLWWSNVVPDGRGMSMDEMMDAMDEITDLQRQVISMRFGAGLSVAETAQSIKKKEGAVKALQHSAIQALRRRMAQRGHATP